MNTCTVNAMWATSLPMSAPLRPYGRPFRQHLHRHRRRDKLIAGMRKTSSPTSGSSMPYGRPFRQQLHHHRRKDKLIAGMRQTSSPTSGSSTPYGRPVHQHLHCQAGNGSLPPSAPKTPPTYAHLPEKLTSRLRLLMCYSIFVLYYSVHSVIVLFHHHGSGGSCVASGDYISVAQHNAGRTLSQSTRSGMIIS